MEGTSSAKKIWICFVNFRDEGLKNEIRKAFESRGIETVAHTSRDSPGAGVIVFQELSDLLWITLDEYAREGPDRILALHAGSCRIDGGRVWELLRHGASDVKCWNGSAEDIVLKIERWYTVDKLIRSAPVRGRLVGSSPIWLERLRHIVEIAHFTDSPVLITGETGTGKELVARIIHDLDTRREKSNLIVADCTTIVPELAGSEFFGHQRGSYTSAIADREGAFKRANKGTLFLDEVADLPPALQAQLLRVVQEGTFKPVGGNIWEETHFRLVCATNRDLSEEIRYGRFRRDLYYRIAVQTCHLPPLREREEDIVPLALHFIEQETSAGSCCGLEDGVADYLRVREYPGNIRDLRQLIIRMVAGHVGNGPLSLADIPPEERGEKIPPRGKWADQEFEDIIAKAVSSGVNLKEIGRIAEDAAVRIALARENGNVSRAAQILGVTSRALQMRRALWREQNSQSDPLPREN